MKCGKTGERNPFYGKHHTKESKEKNRNAHLKENLSKETIKRMSDSHRGFKHTEESKQKMSVARQGENHPSYGKKRSVEQRQRMVKAQKKYWDDPASREKASIAQKKYWDDPISHEKASATQQGIPYEEWESFACELPYCPDFNEKCRESNREKYNRKCFLTGLPESENIDKNGKQRKLSIHHVDMDKGQGCNGKRWRLVPVCMNWHGKVHNELWESRIIWLLDNVWCGSK
jgi:hypothetical protein